MEVNQGPNRLWYEPLALQLMQFPGMWLNECHAAESSKPSFSTPWTCIFNHNAIKQKVETLLAVFLQPIQNC